MEDPKLPEMKESFVEGFTDDELLKLYSWALNTDVWPDTDDIKFINLIKNEIKKRGLIV